METAASNLLFWGNSKGVPMKFFSTPLTRIRILLVFFMIGLVISGLSAIPAYWEATFLKELFGSHSWINTFLPGISQWVDRIYTGVVNSYGSYPFLAYPNDWLAFGHVAIAVAFIGPLRDPIKNIWVVDFGIIICFLVIPWAIIFGPLRGIPWFWTLIDMSFGIIGIIPLLIVRKIIFSFPQHYDDFRNN